MKKVLIIAPHCDDAEFAMAGTIVRMIDSGFEVTIADLTDGEPTPLGSKQIRKKETETASEILKIQNRISLNMPNRYLFATLKNRKKIAEVIRQVQPDILFGPVEPDFHPDHVAATKLIDSARFEAKLCKTRLAGERHWTAMRMGYYSPHRLDCSKPGFIVNITKQWKKKLSAIEAYQSQIKSDDYSNATSLVEKIELTNRYFGQCIGVRYGEPFFNYQPISENQLNLKA